MPTLNDPIAIAIGPVEVRWYALFIVTGIVLAVWQAVWLANKRGLDGETLLDIAPVVVIAAILGARAYYVLLEWDRFQDDLLAAINLRTGGLSIHGAIVVGVITAWLMLRNKEGSVWQWFDVMIPALALGQAIGRWGNWANQEAFGTPTDLPWAVWISPSRRPSGYEQFESFHPTFLYESLLTFTLCTALVLLVLNQESIRWYRPGMAFGIYLAAYGVIRLILESIRTDSLYIGPLPAAYWFSFAMLIAGAAVIWWRWSQSQQAD